MTDDLISRKILIEKLGISTECVDCQHKLNGLCLWKPNMVDVCEVITEMPSAQLEPLTDKEQRIFLAAMGREEVCKQVDEECRDCIEPYEDSLIRTCREIIRKVKGALWTI